MSMRTRVKGLLGLLAALIPSANVLAYDITDWAINFQDPATPMAREIYDVHMLVYWICVAIFVLVFGVMFYSIWKFRKSKGARPASFHENTTIELVWTAVPFLILVGIAVPATQTLIAVEDTADADMSILITGYQWRWHYEYLDEEEDISFFSNLTTPRAQIRGEEPKSQDYLLAVDNRLVIPTDTRIRFLMTSNDVIHAWWIPTFGFKKDAIPGFITEAWAVVEEPGIYRGVCAELCGRGHAYMPAVVEAMAPEDYEDWIGEQREVARAEAEAEDREWDQEELVERGQEVYNTSCATCHQEDGSGVPDTFPPLVDNELVVGDMDPVTEVVIHGVEGTAMPAFGPQLSNADLAAVVTYIRNAWGNDVGDMVSPAEIEEAR